MDLSWWTLQAISILFLDLDAALKISSAALSNLNPAYFTF